MLIDLPILVVEDSEDDILLLKHAWKKAGLDVPVIYTGDGAEAIQWLQQAVAGEADDHPMPKLLLTDLKMPKVSGFEVLDFLKSNPGCQTITPLVWSSSTEISDLRRAHALGARCYLPKPHEEQGWKTLVQTIMTFYQA